MKVIVAKHSELGDRERNEDYIAMKSTDARHIFALADGLGGHGLGDEASRLVCETAISHIDSLPKGQMISFDSVYKNCQNTLLEKQVQMGVSGKMRTTLNLLYIENDTAYWNHIGDSRTYYFQNNQLIKRTFDHSVPQMLVAAGELDESQIRFHEDRNRLLRVLGVHDHFPSFEKEDSITLKGNEQFLLCSDGFWELITEEQILLCLDESENPQLWIDNMMELVHKNSKSRTSDNISVIAVWIKGE